VGTGISGAFKPHILLYERIRALRDDLFDTRQSNERGPIDAVTPTADSPSTLVSTLESPSMQRVLTEYELISHSLGSTAKGGGAAVPDQLSPDTALSTLLTRLLLASAASADVAYVTVPDTESANVITERQWRSSFSCDAQVHAAARPVLVEGLLEIERKLSAIHAGLSGSSIFSLTEKSKK